MSADAKFAPGPWRLSRTKKYVMDTYGAPWVCEVSARPELDANAHLIAAAPDLYAACKALIAYDEDARQSDLSIMVAYDDAITKARSAIAKAEGRS